MICSLLKREIEIVCRSVVRFVDISVCRAMSCFLGCFRIRDDRHRPTRPHHLFSTSHSIRSHNSTEDVVSHNRLSNLFLYEEKEESSSINVENLGFGSPQTHKELKDEAKFLKGCGTLVETPAEIRKLKGSPHSEPPKFHSWLPNTSIKKLQLENQPDQPPTPVKLCEEWGKGSGLTEESSSSCISSVQNPGRISFSSTEGSGTKSVNTAVQGYANQNENIATVSPWLSATDIQRRNKSVRFECDFDLSSSRSSSENVDQNRKKFETPGNESASKHSPYPTPLKLSDEMQTPGTVFPSNLETYPSGKTRIRSQYVYSVLNPVESNSQWKVLMEEGSDSCQLSSELRESLEPPENETPRPDGGIKESLSGKESKVEASLSDWLKPKPSTQDENSKNIDTVSTRNPHFGRTPSDRPIIGIVAAHWNEEEVSRVSPKWWDGNGIPNSTNKYKEDQKVSWHATPFEERLEKALSEESGVSQRKNGSGKPIVFDENEESDTALSQLQSSTHQKPVVSF